MLKSALLSVGVAVLAVGSFVGAGSAGASGAQEAKVGCCGECKPGDDCLIQCDLKGEAAPGAKVACCGGCEKGEDCLKVCPPKKASCCEVK